MLHKICSGLLVGGCVVVFGLSAVFSGPRLVEGDSLAGIVGAKDDCDVQSGGNATEPGPTCPVAPNHVECTSTTWVCKGSKAGDNNRRCESSAGNPACVANGNCQHPNNDGATTDCNPT